MRREPIPYGRQSMHPDDLDAIAAVLFSDWLTTGPQNDAFEARPSAETGRSPPCHHLQLGDLGAAWCLPSSPDWDRETWCTRRR